MRHITVLLYSPTLQKANIKRIVRASGTDDAIENLVRTIDRHRIYAAYAYPMKRRSKGPMNEDWRRNICCSVSGTVVMDRGNPFVKETT